MLPKPIRGKSNNLKTHHKKAANDSALPAISQALSTSTSSLGSEVVEERSLGSLRKPAQELSDDCRTAESVEATHLSEVAGEETVQSQREAPGEGLMTNTIVERNRSRVSTVTF